MHKPIGAKRLFLDAFNYMKQLFLSIISALFTLALFAQSQKIIVDGIAAQVGDKIILRADVEREEYEFSHSRPNPCNNLEKLLEEKAFAALAEKLYVAVDKDTLEQLLDNQIRSFISMYGSKKELEAAANKTVNQIREDIREPFNDRMLTNKLRNNIQDTLTVTPGEVQACYNKIPKDSLPYIEATFKLYQLVINPKPSAGAEQDAFTRLTTWKHQVETGAKTMDKLARLYSQDAGSRDYGGIYSVNINDKQWDSTWFAAIWKLSVGQVSPIVQSSQGFHIIQLVSRDGEYAVIRHIQLMPATSQSFIANTKALLDTVRLNILDGRLSFKEAVEKYGNSVTSSNGGAVLLPVTGSPFVTLDNLDRDMATLVKNMRNGEVSTPQVYTDDRLQTAIRIVYLQSTTAEHIENLQEDYDDVARQVLNKKKEQVLHQYILNNIQHLNVHIAETYKACPNIGPWVAANR
jgi:peptidyl-prolyl cis-trans isomerase SurA